jgi:K(+)-stimulated pyrophosphate-energized sodium pump
VLIGTAVVGATTMIFSIVVSLTHGLVENLQKLSILHPPFLARARHRRRHHLLVHRRDDAGGGRRCLPRGGVHPSQHEARGLTKASIEDSKKVVEICTLYAQKGMTNIFLTIFCATLAFACLDPFFFIGYLISLALFGLFQALFLANAGGAWDNAKKIVEVELATRPRAA